MNLQWLYYFNAVAETEHYTQAAEKLHISQSNLSHAIKELEREVGAQLFERRGRNVRLTRYGKMFHPYVQKTLNTLEKGVSTLKEYIDPNQGTIVLAGFQSLGQFSTDLMVRYQADTNRLDVRFEYTSLRWPELCSRILDGTADLVLGSRVERPEIEGTCIGVHPLVALVPIKHRFAEDEELDIRRINGENFISFDRFGHIYAQLKKFFQSTGIQPNIIGEMANDQIIYGMVAAGRGISIVPYPLAGAPYGTKILPIANDVPRRDIYLQWNKERYIPPAAEYFRDYVIRNKRVLEQYLVNHGIRLGLGSQK